MTTAVFIGVKYGEQVGIAAKCTIYIFCIPPHIAHIGVWPRNRRTDVIIVIHRNIIVVKFPVEQLDVFKPMLLPGGGWRLGQHRLYNTNKKE
jgi:hypothetical protein